MNRLSILSFNRLNLEAKDCDSEGKDKYKSVEAFHLIIIVDF